MEGLEYHPHPPTDGAELAGACAGKAPAQHADLAAGGFLQAVETAKQRALTRAGGADDGDDVSAGDLRADILKRRHIGIGLFQMGDGDDRLSFCGGLGSGNGGGTACLPDRHERPAPPLGIDAQLNPPQQEGEEPGQQKVDRGRDEEREESLEGAAADEVGGLGQVLHGDVAHH